MKKILATTLATALAVATISGTMVYGEEVEFEGETYEVIGAATDDQDYNTLQESYEERGIDDDSDFDDEESEYYNSTTEAGGDAYTIRGLAEEEKACYESAVGQYETDNATYQKEADNQATQIAAYEQAVKDYEEAKEAYDTKEANMTSKDIEGYSFEVSKTESWNSGKDKIAEVTNVNGVYYVRLEGKKTWTKADKVVKKNKIKDMEKFYDNLAKKAYLGDEPTKPEELNLPTLTPPEAPKSDNAKAAYEKAEAAYKVYLEKLHAYVEWLNNKTTPEPPVDPDEVVEAREDYIEANNEYVAECVEVTKILKDAQRKVSKYIYNDYVRSVIKNYYWYCEDGHDITATNEYVVLCCMMNDIQTACYVHGRACQVSGVENNVRGAFAINSWVEFITNYNPKASFDTQIKNLLAFYNKLV